MFRLAGALFAALLASTFAAPLDERATDPPYSFPTSVLDAAIVCPYGLTGAKRGIVLLVHGTGSRGDESWQNGPYVQLLPKAASVDSCYVNLGNRSLSDAQYTAEYVAYAIDKLAAQSKTRKVTIIGHSQGAGLNIPWALLYWPSARAKVSNFIALAGDLRGTTTAAPLACTAFQLAEGGYCYAGILQQQPSSYFLAAQNKRGSVALVPTLSVFTLTDDVIAPEPYTSTFGGSAVDVSVQSICGVAHVADHFTMLIDSYNLALATVVSGKPSQSLVQNFDKARCLTIAAGKPQADFNDIVSVAQTAALGFIGAGALFGTDPSLRVKVEPKLKPYVCAAGDSTYC